MWISLKFQSAIDFVNYTTDSLIMNPKISEEDIIEILEDIMDQEFDTVCDDNSIVEVSRVLVRYFQLIQNNQQSQVALELAQLPPCEKWIVPGGRVKIIQQEDSSSDDDDDDMMDTSDSPAAAPKPSTSGSTMQFVEEDVDPGWTMVKSGKKKK